MILSYTLYFLEEIIYKKFYIRPKECFRHFPFIHLDLSRIAYLREQDVVAHENLAKEVVKWGWRWLMFGLWFKKNEIYCGQKGFSEAGEQDCQEVPVLEENNRSEGYKDYWDGRSRISLACFDWYQHLLEYNLASFIFLLCSTVFSYKCSLQRQENLWICNRNLCACLAAPAMSDSSPLSMGFSRQENWSGSPSPPPGDLPNSGIKPASFMSPALAGGYFTTSATWEARWATIKLLCYFAFKSFKKKLWEYTWFTMLY